MATGSPAPPTWATDHGLPVWFGRQSRLFGVVHVPDGGRALGGVVLCAPLGIEHKASHTTYRMLAERLLARSLVVLRFDYRGTGDSAGEAPAHGWDAWLREDVVTAVDFVRECGVPTVSVIGMRMGATIAYSALRSTSSLDALVLWDPCVTARTFVRAERMLLSAATGQDSIGEVGEWTEGSEMRYPVDLPLALDASPEIPPPTRSLVLTRPDRPVPAEVDRLADALGADRLPAEHQAELLEVPSTERAVPFATVEAIAGWVADGITADETAVTVPPAMPAVMAGDARSSVVERAERLGPGGVFTIVAEPEGGADAHLPTVLFLSVANDHRAASGRLWVHMARRLALAGFRCARFDLTGMGDSDPRPGSPEGLVFSVEHFGDVVDVARALSPQDPSDVIVVGLCSSAYLALESSYLLGARGVCAINPVVHFPAPEAPDESFPVDPRRRFHTHPSGALAVKDVRAIRWVRRRYPSLAWRVAHLLAGPGGPLDQVVEMAAAGTKVRFVLGEWEARALRHSSPRRYGELAHIPGITLVEDRDLLHHLPRYADRQVAVREIESFVRSFLVPGA